jgi:HEAT repeat protein
VIGSVCPQCEKPIVPGGGSVAKIRGMKVVTYCSAACAEGKVTPVAVSFPAPAPVAPKVEAPVVVAAAKPKPVVVDEGWEEPQVVAKAKAPGGGKGVIVVAGLALVAGAVIVGSRFWPGKANGSEEERQVEASAGPVPAAVAGAAASSQAPSEPPRLDPGQLYERALGDLKGLMGSASARVQRIAAMAMARTGDQAAMARLRGLLAAEKNPLVRVEIAYALARAGDQDGLGELHAALKSSQRRDARLDAARSLVLLDDSRGADQLREFLSYTEYRIGAAGLLARIGDEKGIAALRQAIAERKRFPENEMRAVVALGAAGDRSVQPRLLEILRDGRYQIGACQALAVLGDPAAIPALVQQLDVDAFRVAAAVALRRMKAKVDLAPLAAALEGGNDVVRVTAGEAILVLTGPEKLVERD